MELWNEYKIIMKGMEQIINATHFENPAMFQRYAFNHTHTEALMRHFEGNGVDLAHFDRDFRAEALGLWDRNAIFYFQHDTGVFATTIASKRSFREDHPAGRDDIAAHAGDLFPDADMTTGLDEALDDVVVGGMMMGVSVITARNVVDEEYELAKKISAALGIFAMIALKARGEEHIVREKRWGSKLAKLQNKPPIVYVSLSKPNIVTTFKMIGTKPKGAAAWRMPIHFVREHLRQYRSGKVAYIRPHYRGDENVPRKTLHKVIP